MRTPIREKLQRSAIRCENARPGTRTPNPLIKSQLPEIENSRTDNDLDESASGRAADMYARVAENAALRAVVDAWPELPEAVRAGILAMVRASVDTA